MKKAAIFRILMFITLAVVIVLSGCQRTVKTMADNKAPEGLNYRNPLVKNAADPSVIKANDGIYYAYVTGFKDYSSPDLVHWKAEGQALNHSELPWATGDYWAPDVKMYNGKYYMFFSATPNGSYPRISVAVSDKPNGPFKALSDKPLFDFGYGSIDPFVLFDTDGKIYMYYTQNLQQVDDHKESHIFVVELNPDLKSYIGEPKQLTKPKQSWENKGNMRWNEGSWVIKHDDTYYLMYSANCYCGKNYSVGYATSKSPLGPFIKYDQNPVLNALASDVSGTGHHAVVPSPDGKELYIVYHSHMDVKKGGGDRQLNIDRMGFRADGTIYVDGPTLTEQPLPSGTNEWTNIAAAAKITAGPGNADNGLAALTDGEIGIYKRADMIEWAAPANANSSSPTWVKLEWDQPREINSVWIYDSGNPAEALQSGKLYLDDGTEIDGIAFSNKAGAAAIAHLDGKKVKWMKFVPDQPAADQKVVLSEIMVLGK